MEARMQCVFLSLLSLIAAASSQQGEFVTFDAIKDALLLGTELQLNALSQNCEVTNLERDVVFSMPMRDWVHLVYPDESEEIRAHDFYILTMNEEEERVVMRTIFIHQDNIAKISLVSSSINFDSNTTRATKLNCTLGSGAVAHPIVPGQNLDTLDTYNEVKSRLLFGAHVESIAFLNACDNAEEVLQSGNTYVVGFEIEKFEVYNDGTAEEFLLINDVSVLSPNGEIFGVGAENMILYRDGSATLTFNMLQPDTFEEIAQFSLSCRLENALKFTYHQRESDTSLVTYDEVRDATLRGHDMELVSFLDSCQVVEGSPIESSGMIISVRFDEFQLFKAGDLWGEQEHITFSTWTVSAQRQLMIDVVRMYPDNDLTIDYTIFDLVAGETVTGILSCPLQTASLFHSVSRNRQPVDNYLQILNAILNRGQIFEIEVDYDLCDAGGVQLQSIFGGIAWQTYISAPPESFLYVNEFAPVILNGTDGTPTPAWDAAGILVRPDNTVSITTRLYDWTDGQNLLDPDMQPINCELGVGVQFFRYP